MSTATLILLTSLSGVGLCTTVVILAKLLLSIRQNMKNRKYIARRLAAAKNITVDEWMTMGWEDNISNDCLTFHTRWLDESGEVRYTVGEDWMDGSYIIIHGLGDHDCSRIFEMHLSELPNLQDAMRLRNL